MIAVIGPSWSRVGSSFAELSPSHLYVRYPKGDVQIPNPDPGDLGAHFATLTHDRDDLTGWVADRFRD
ncbi:hypothetical protein [Nocardia sp. NPDC049149]|uniref:hypothetical protein n=1 Tax=Nocardia sp. NPDC049149 TaxID=3364315 RepID=UPI00371E6FC3